MKGISLKVGVHENGMYVDKGNPTVSTVFRNTLFSEIEEQQTDI